MDGKVSVSCCCIHCVTVAPKMNVTSSVIWVFVSPRCVLWLTLQVYAPLPLRKVQGQLVMIDTSHWDQSSALSILVQSCLFSWVTGSCLTTGAGLLLQAPSFLRLAQLKQRSCWHVGYGVVTQGLHFNMLSICRCQEAKSLLQVSVLMDISVKEAMLLSTVVCL